jgi:hypothetical protein
MQMPTFEELRCWTPDEIETAIRLGVPHDIQFACGLDREAGAWFVRFWREDAEGKKTILFEDWGFEQRITYLNAYGWMWVRQQPKPSPVSPWARRGEVPIARRKKPPQVPDPEDLNPEEVLAVYAQAKGHPCFGGHSHDVDHVWNRSP